MMAIPHMTAGAAIGRYLRRPWLAWPVAFASHFLLDAVPHVDSHNLFGVEEGGPTLPEAVSATLDFALGSLLVAWLVWRRPNRRVLLGSALCAIIIDVVDHVPPFGLWFKSWPATAWLSDFHDSFRINVSPGGYLPGVATQVGVMAVALWALLPRPRWRTGPGTVELRRTE